MSMSLKARAQWEAAAAAAREAVEITLDAAETDDGQLARLPRAVELLVITSRESATAESARQLTFRAVTAYRELNARSRQQHERGLMRLLSSYGTLLRHCRDFEPALRTLSIVEDFYRPLVQETEGVDVESAIPLAGCLYSAAEVLSELDRYDEAAIVMSEVVDLHQGLLDSAEERLGAGSPAAESLGVELAGSLRFLADVRGAGLGDYDASLEPARTSVELLERNKRANSSERAMRAGALMALADAEFATGQRGRAIVHSRRAVRLLEECARNSPWAAAELANALSHVAGYQYNMGNRARALALSEAAIVTYNDCVKQYPECFRPKRGLILYKQHKQYSTEVLRAPSDGATRAMQAAEGLGKLLERITD